MINRKKKESLQNKSDPIAKPVDNKKNPDRKTQSSGHNPFFELSMIIKK